MQIRALLRMQMGRAAENTAIDLEGRRPPGRREVRGQGVMREALKHQRRPPNYNKGGVHGRGGEPPTLGALWELPQSISIWAQKAPGNGRAGDSDYCPICIARSIVDVDLSLYEFVCRMGDGPVFTGAALRPQWPPSGAYARVMLLLHKPWRQASDLRDDSSETWAPGFSLCLAQEECPLALEVNVERAKAVSRARNRVWEDPTHPEVADPEDYDEDDPRIYAPRDEDAADMSPEISDFEDYGCPSDWPSVSDAVGEEGFPGPDASATWLPTRVAQVRATGGCEGFPPRPRGAGAGINPIRRQSGAAIPDCARPPNYPRMGQRKRRLQAASPSNRRRFWCRKVVCYPRTDRPSS